MSQDGPPYQVTGSMIEVMDILAETLDFCFKYVVPDDRQFGRQDANGSWTGMIGLLARHEADMTGVVVGLDLDRRTVADFSDFLYMDQERLIYKRPVVESDMAGFLKPFTLSSWMMVVATLVAMAGVVLLTRQVTPQPARHCPGTDGESSRQQETVWNSLLDTGLWSVAVSLAQSSTLVPRGMRQKAVVGMWLLLALIISTVYRSNLKAMLIKPRLVLPFSNLEELVETSIPCFTFRGTLLHRNIEAAEEGTTMWRLNKVLYTHNDVALGVRDMSLGKHVLFTTYVGLLSVLHSHFLQTKSCSLYMTDDSYYGSKSLTLAFPKGSQLRQKVDPIIVKLREFGILGRAFMKFVAHSKTCLNSDPGSVDSALRPLQMGDMYGVCLVYVGGITLAAATLLMEVVIALRKRGGKRSARE
ncbi:hypothetical protein O3P69_016421 [Scylla paramamosain]|uniref:Uncharacterized protein n=2 Tax=Scylla paramamosain TaxID=85552 RepID=A0AAW0TG59_SCYPA